MTYFLYRYVIQHNSDIPCDFKFTCFPLTANTKFMIKLSFSKYLCSISSSRFANFLCPIFWHILGTSLHVLIVSSNTYSTFTSWLNYATRTVQITLWNHYSRWNSVSDFGNVGNAPLEAPFQFIWWICFRHSTRTFGKYSWLMVYFRSSQPFFSMYHPTNVIPEVQSGISLSLDYGYKIHFIHSLKILNVSVPVVTVVSSTVTGVIINLIPMFACKRNFFFITFLFHNFSNREKSVHEPT